MPAFQRYGWKRYEFIKRLVEWCGVDGGAMELSPKFIV